MHDCWLEPDQLLKNSHKLKGIPGIIMQGRHASLHAPGGSLGVKQTWPEVELQIVDDGGHLFTAAGNYDGLVRASDRFAGKSDKGSASRITQPYLANRLTNAYVRWHERYRYLVIDNYDSFTWNLVHYLMELGAKVEVVRNDAISARGRRIERGQGFSGFHPVPAGCPTKPGSASIWLAPAPLRVSHCSVCAWDTSHIGQYFGGSGGLMHGKTDNGHSRQRLFAGLPLAVQGDALSLADRR